MSRHYQHGFPVPLKLTDDDRRVAVLAVATALKILNGHDPAPWVEQRLLEIGEYILTNGQRLHGGWPRVKRDDLLAIANESTPS